MVSRKPIWKALSWHSDNVVSFYTTKKAWCYACPFIFLLITKANGSRVWRVAQCQKLANGNWLFNKTETTTVVVKRGKFNYHDYDNNHGRAENLSILMLDLQPLTFIITRIWQRPWNSEADAKLKKMIKAKLACVLAPSHFPPGTLALQSCLSRADRITGRYYEETEFRCFMASAEARSPSLRKLVWHNLELLQDALSYSDGHERAANLICQSLPESLISARSRWRRLLSRNYFLAWCCCRAQPRQSFLLIHKKFAHHRRRSKARQSGVDLPWWQVGQSYWRKNWKEAIVYNEEEAAELGLEIDHDDTHAAFGAWFSRFYCMAHSQGGAQPRRWKSQKKGGKDIELLILLAVLYFWIVHLIRTKARRNAGLIFCGK